jgi:hypothetical protein
MKITTFISIFTLLLIIGCKKPLLNPDNSHQDDCWSPPTSLPENDGVVYNLAFMKNDTVWAAAQTTNGIVDLALSGVPISLTYNFSESSGDNNLAINGKLSIQDSCNNIFSRLRFYIINPIEGNNDSISLYSEFADVNNNITYDIVINNSLNMNLNKFDKEIGRAEGEFEFDLVNTRDIEDTIHIRQGRFEGDF